MELSPRQVDFVALMTFFRQGGATADKNVTFALLMLRLNDTNDHIPTGSSYPFLDLKQIFAGWKVLHFTKK